jgi:NTE family protein
MATKNFSFTQGFKFFLLSTLLIGCQSLKTRSQISQKENQNPSSAATAKGSEQIAPPAYQDEQPAPPLVSTTEIPKIGLVLGPGSMRAYAHIGVIEELSKLRAPIVAVAGIEMGALVGAIYSNKGQPFDVEWQMMKLKEDDLDRGNLNEFMSLVFSGSRAENAKVPFACPALNMQKQQMYMMNRGVFTQMLPYCLSLPPFFRPYKNNVAGVLDLKSAVDYVRAKGANYVIYVNLLDGPARVGKNDTEAQTIWTLAAHSLERQKKTADQVIDVPLRDVELNDFKSRRDVLQRGRQAGQEAAAQISQRFGL